MEGPTIRSRLTAGFGLALMLMLAVGLFGVLQIRTISRFVGEIAETWLPQRQLLGDIKYAVIKHRLAVTRHMQAPVDLDGAALAADLEKNRAALYSARRSFEKAAGAEKARFAAFIDDWRLYEASLDETVARLDRGDVRGAVQYFDSTSLAAFEGAVAKLDEVLRQSRLASVAATDRARHAYEAGLTLLTLMAAFATLLVGLAVFWVTRTISAPILKVAQTMNRLAAGDTTVEAIDTRGETTEVAALMAAVIGYRDSLLRGRELEQFARLQRERLETAVGNMPIGLCMFDGGRRMIICNGHFADMYRLPPELTAPGTPIEDIVRHAVESTPGSDADSDSVLEGLLVAMGSPFAETIEVWPGRFFRIIHQPIPGGGWLSIHEDVTERREAEARIAAVIRHDPLTGLANRMLFRERAREMLGRAGEGGSVALFAIDLDDFKRINDMFGHAVGDGVLRGAAERLANLIGEGGMVARISGDQFAILQGDGEQPQAATRLAGQVLDALGAPYLAEGTQIVSGASIGIAIAPADGTDVDELMKRNEIALHRAKSEGRNAYRFFERSMDSMVEARRRLETDLRLALRRGEFELFYQPYPRLSTDTIVGFEALVRWRHPTRGLVGPDEFIPLAEEIGLIVPMGEWILRQACRDAATKLHGARVAVNLSSVQFDGPNLMSAVVAALSAAGLPPARLELEITETVLLADSAKTLATLNQLHGLGVRLSMDDFGAGYSSLNYFRTFPFDKVKLDRSFVADPSPSSRAIMRAVGGLSPGLGISTSAEGVETAAQLELVRDEGFTEAQGYFISPPVPIEQVPGLFTAFPVEAVAA